LLRSSLAIALAGAGVSVSVVACNGGTAVFDAVDPKQCATGNGCPMVACACNDGSFMIDSTCELGKCLSSDSVCADRCSPFMGVKTLVATQNDNVAIPGCDALAERMQINRCGEGTELIASECQATNVDCSPQASSFWKCVIEAGVISCKRGALRVEGCAAETADVCTAAQPPANG
jgi:hypothetical protein